jgi:hypothetical protein
LFTFEFLLVVSVTIVITNAVKTTAIAKNIPILIDSCNDAGTVVFEFLVSMKA